MKLIATQTLTSSQPDITFSAIPQNFTDLMVKISVRSDRSAGADTISMKLNGSTANFTTRILEGNGSSAYSESTSTSPIGYVSASTGTSNTFGSAEIYLPNYAGSTNKSYSSDSVQEANTTAAVQQLFAGLWSQTAAITSLTIYPLAGPNFVAGSTISLYGIGGAGDAYLPKALGGNFQLLNGYWVHTFTSSGTFTPLENLTDVEYLVIAGGGGGRTSTGGGGGAGGYRSSVTGENSGGGASAESKLSLSSGTAYTVTVGAGGAAEANGVDSTFSTITSTGGGTGNASGGSGGGGYSGATGTFRLGGAATTGQGFAGGDGNTTTGGSVFYGPGGGGGASQTGFPGFSGGGRSLPRDGRGGNGVASSITGTSVTRAGGGGGGTDGQTTATNPGGTGGGGAGGAYIAALAGTANTGGGGGGGGVSTTNVGGAGGSGIVIVRYAA
jgi:hypothetical protein